jgi:hypothetical protein
MDLNYIMKTNQRKIIIINGNYEIIKTAIRANEHNFHFNIVSMETVTKIMKSISVFSELGLHLLHSFP